MNYHIDTGLILQEFNDKTECPLCRIRAIVEAQHVDKFLNEAVMSDDARKRVNDRGFCRTHYSMMFKRQNKLGLALQNITRMTVLYGELKITDNIKAAKKQADVFEKASLTCLICDLTEDNMVRYSKTAAQMFSNEKGFKDILLSTRGFCLPHYSMLLRYSDSAKSQTKEYLKTLTTLQKDNFERVAGELQWFCDKHDYRNVSKPWGSAEDALPRSIEKLHIKQQD